MATRTEAKPVPHPRVQGADREALPEVGSLAVFIILCQAVGFVGTLVGGQGALYRELTLPGWAPPGSVFGPVWVVLYSLMGIAAWLVWRTGKGPARRSALGWFVAQLVVNALWTPVFFGAESPIGGLILLALLLPLITGTIIAFGKRSTLAAALLVPYWLWAGFALVLNGAIVWLNR